MLKRRAVALTLVGSILFTTGGFTLITFSGGLSFILGGIIIGVGVSATIASIYEGMRKNKKFNFKRWGSYASLGAAGSAISGPVYLGGTALASTAWMTSNAVLL